MADSLLPLPPCPERPLLQFPHLLLSLLDLCRVKLTSRLLRSGSSPTGPVQSILSKPVPSLLPPRTSGRLAPKRRSENTFERQNKVETAKRNRDGKYIHCSLDLNCPCLSRAIPPQMCLISREMSPRSSHVKDLVPHAEVGPLVMQSQGL